MKHFYERNSYLLEHEVNKTFEEVLWMSDEDFRTWLRDMRKEVVYSWGGTFTLWERISKDSIWTLVTFNMAQLNSLYKHDKLKTLDGKYGRFKTSLDETDIITYTYRF